MRAILIDRAHCRALLRRPTGKPNWLAACVIGIWVASCTGTPDPQVSLRDAADKYAAGDYRTAVIQLRNVLQADADNTAAHVLIGRIALATRDFQQAQASLERARNLGAPLAEYAVPLADLWVQTNEAPAALELLRTVPEESRDAAYWLVTTDALTVTGELEEAEAAVDGVARTDGETPAVLLRRARLAATAGRLDVAQARLDDALAIDAANADALALRGSIAGATRQLESAANDLDAAADLYEARGLAAAALPLLLNLVQVQLALNRIDDASVTASRLAALAPAFGDYAQGLVEYQRGNFNETIQLLRRALAAAPGQPQLRSLLGAAQLAVGNFGQAEQEFLAVLSEKPSDPAAVQLLAEVRIRQQRPQAALEALRLVEFDDQNVGMIVLHGAAYLENDEPEQAIPYLEQAMSLRPGNQAIVLRLFRAYVAVGRSDDASALLGSIPGLGVDATYAGNVEILLGRLQANDVEGARNLVDDVRRADPEDPRAYMVAAVFNQLIGDNAAARASVDTALRLDPEFIPGRLMLAAWLADEGRTDEAERQLREVARLDTGDAAALMFLAELALEKGDVAGAEIHLTEATKRSEALEPRVALTRLHIATGQLDKAEAQLEAVSQQSASHPEVLLTRGFLALAKGVPADAVVPLRAALVALPARSDVALLLAEAQARLGALDDARDTLLAATQSMPTVPTLRAALGAAELRLGDSAEALRIAKQLQVEFTRQPAGYALEAEIRMAERNYADAVRYYDSAYERGATWGLLTSVVSALRLSGQSGGEERIAAWLTANPDDARARLFFAEFLSAANRSEDALAEYQRVLVGDPGNVIALNNGAWLAFQLARPEALDYARRAAVLAPENPAVLDTLGWILAEQGKPAEAVGYIEKAYALWPESPDVQYHLGAVQARLGRADAARQTLQSVLSRDEPFEQRSAAEALLESL